MITLTPREDLCLLTAVYNNPDADWDIISQYILHNYYGFIPPEICKDRYSTFLCKVFPITELYELVPEDAKNYNLAREVKAPEDFAYHYAELKKKTPPDQTCQTAISNFQKRIVKKVLFGQREGKTKKIQKADPSQECKQRLVDAVYEIVKDGKRGTMNQARIEEGFQQLLIGVFEQCNSILKAEQEQISNPLSVVKLFKSNKLVDERREIIEKYISKKPLDFETAEVIAGKFKYVITVYGYGQLNFNEEECVGAQEQSQSTVDVNPVEYSFWTEEGKKIDDNDRQHQMTELEQPPADPKHFTDLYFKKSAQTTISPPHQQHSLINHAVQTPHQVEPAERTRPRLGFSSMQITVTKNQVKIVNQEKKPEEDVKLQAKQQLQQYVKEQVQTTGQKKTYRMVKKDKAKIPKNGKTVLTIKD